MLVTGLLGELLSPGGGFRGNDTSGKEPAGGGDDIARDGPSVSCFYTG